MHGCDVWGSENLLPCAGCLLVPVQHVPVQHVPSRAFVAAIPQREIGREEEEIRVGNTRGIHACILQNEGGGEGRKGKNITERRER